MARIHRYRSIWVSDTHLGTVRCDSSALLDFLQHHEAETLYLVGDILDGWHLGPHWYWDETQEAVAREIRAWRRRGTKVVFLPGNHDERSCDLVQSLLDPNQVHEQLVHRTAEGRRMLVIHGHQFDGSLNPNRWISVMGANAYSVALRINRWYSREWNRSNPPNRSLTAYLQGRVKRTVHYLTDFDDKAVFAAAHRYRVDGVICGHTHRPEQRLIGSIWYLNDGDWVESLTALVEHHDGALRLIRWGDELGHYVPDEPVAQRAAS